MKLSKFFAYLMFLSLISFVACSDDDDDPNDEVGQQEVEAAFKEMDETMGNMLSQSSAFSAVFALSGIENPPVELNTEDPLALLLELQSLFGTHTYNTDSLKWFYDPQPENEVILNYPVSSTQTAEIRLYNFSLDEGGTEAAFSLSVSIDEVSGFDATFTLFGTNLLNPFAEQEITSATISGTITDQTGISYNLNLSLNSTTAEVTIGLASATLVSITATGTNLLDPTFGEGETESQIDEVTFTYRELQLVIDDPDAESGDIGDVFYSGEKVGDLVLEEGEEGELLIVFNNGNEVELLSLLPNINSLLLIFEGFGSQPV